MRIAVIVLLLSGVVLAADRERVRSLVERLSAGSASERRRAFVRLSRMGEEIVPLLREFASPDPEVRRRLRQLMRSARRVRLHALAPAEPLPLGEAVRIEVRLDNETEDTFALRLVDNPRRGSGTRSTFLIEYEDGRAVRLKPDQVRTTVPPAPKVTLPPGGHLRCHIELSGETLPLRQPGARRLVVRLDELAERWDGQPRPSRVRLRLRSTPLEVSAYGRKPEELERALTSGVASERASAINELEIRNDKEILPVLRRHAGDRDLRLAAVRILGEAADEQDLKLILDATRSPDPRVRESAVLALGHYANVRRARSRLLRLAGDHELQAAAVRALRGHKHETTIQRLVGVMPNAPTPVVKQIQDLLEEWTGRIVENRLSEIHAFRRWWAANRETWVSEHFPDRGK